MPQKKPERVKNQTPGNGQPPTEFEKFKELTKRLVSVPKDKIKRGKKGA